MAFNYAKSKVHVRTHNVVYGFLARCIFLTQQGKDAWPGVIPRVTNAAYGSKEKNVKNACMGSFLGEMKIKT